MAQFMDQMWDVMVSAMPTTNKGMMIEKQPGESSYAYSAKKLTEITSKIRTKTGEISVESLRESIVSSCEEFNQGHVFTLIQLGILVYFPSIALAIVYQQDQHEIEQDDEQIAANCMDDMQPQRQPDDMMNIQMQQPQPQSQFINMIQRMIVEIMKQKQQQQQQQKAAKRATKMMKGGKKENEEKKGDDEGRFSVRLEGGQRQKEVVWATVFIQI